MIEGTRAKGRDLVSIPRSWILFFLMRFFQIQCSQAIHAYHGLAGQHHQISVDLDPAPPTCRLTIDPPDVTTLNHTLALGLLSFWAKQKFSSIPPNFLSLSGPLLSPFFNFATLFCLIILIVLVLNHFFHKINKITKYSFRVFLFNFVN